ncbi:hypothetical protein LAZ67_1005149 [Cordylochernes scorpioides]|uniref:Kelch-like protein diablo n=1 Tax=Cordylochernes scorpioides TaxID=51811 RepID=A0ABY6JYT3_9ARAC|nr:hypothetical protein LAZ67_1005149 [Cordylochernes scorpioides]
MAAVDAFAEICTDLSELQQKNQLCDGVLRTSDGQEFWVHRCILFVASPYFRDIYSAALRSGPATDLTLADTQGSVLSLILEYVYTKRANVSMSNVASMIPAAEQFKLPGIAEICSQFLIKNMNIDNCIGIFLMATNFHVRELEQASRRFILSNFYQVLTILSKNTSPINIYVNCVTYCMFYWRVQISKSSKEYISLSPETLESFLRADDLNLLKEELGFEALMRWVEVDPERRRPYLPTLLCCLRFGLCDHRYFMNTVLLHPYIKDTRECQSALVAASHILAEVEGNRNSILDLTHPLLRPRTPNQILFVIGGWSAGAATNLVETYDSRSNRWFIAAVGDIMPSVTAVMCGRAYHGLATVDSRIYMIGGFDGNQYFNSVRCFDPVSHRWAERGCMHEARCYVSTAVLSGRIYALGGYDGHRRTNTGETYDPGTNQWTMIAPMNNRRSDASAAALIDKVYIAGGFDGQVVLDSSEMYDPQQNLWAEIHHMLSPRSGTKLVSYNGSIYVLGGWNGMIRLRSGVK